MMGTESAFTASGSVSAIVGFLSALPFRISLLMVFLYVLFLWLLLVRFVWEDSHLRSSNRFFIKLSLLLVIFFNFPGLFLYLILRPSVTFEEVARAELEDELLKLEVEKLKKEKK